MFKKKEENRDEKEEGNEKEEKYKIQLFINGIFQWNILNDKLT